MEREKGREDKNERQKWTARLTRGKWGGEKENGGRG